LEPGKKRVDSLNGGKVVQELHGVRLCRHCRITWSRDINSAFSMRYLVIYMRDHLCVRPPSFSNPGALSGLSDKDG
jgi:hypothetical protein